MTNSDKYKIYIRYIEKEILRRINCQNVTLAFFMHLILK